ncbi:hypothetical protein CWE14_00775 [Aliidiomarina soli]|uniref:Secondary thiamine-phosphate synthase n=1 Tax=Aliidiomarina soli TaxID=1928574 RepID=A0A432WN08_9GAMM|nr:hypothetical protein CWE14_00775 [Aliidiomarina soli]
MWQQTDLRLAAKPRGFHLITDAIEKALRAVTMPQTGLLHVFLQHTSASISINENADPSVRTDFEAYINRLAPENEPYYTHVYEGDDDMPAHLKSSLLGCQVSIPIVEGRLGLGTWQGIYLGEHRDHAEGRSLILTVQGTK